MNPAKMKVKDMAAGYTICIQDSDVREAETGASFGEGELTGEKAYSPSKKAYLPDVMLFEHWLSKGLGRLGVDSCELTLRIVTEEEAEKLNTKFRGVKAPTNVLSFPCELSDEAGERLLGDIVICHPLVLREAREQGKPVDAHYAHMAIHGLLHLLGYDHMEEAAAQEMEELEVGILGILGFSHPYENTLTGIERI